MATNRQHGFVNDTAGCATVLERPDLPADRGLGFLGPCLKWNNNLKPYVLDGWVTGKNRWKSVMTATLIASVAGTGGVVCRRVTDALANPSDDRDVYPHRRRLRCSQTLAAIEDCPPIHFQRAPHSVRAGKIKGVEGCHPVH